MIHRTVLLGLFSCLTGVASAQSDRQGIISGTFGIKLTELDGNEWSIEVAVDTAWRHYSFPLSSFGEGIDFLNTPVKSIVLFPLGGGGVIWEMSTVVIDWLDDLMLADSSIDNFDDGDYADWTQVIATNGSYMMPVPDPSTPDGSPYCLKITHGNDMGGSFIGWWEKEIDSLWCSPGDTLSIWIRSVTTTPNAVGDEESVVGPGYALFQNYPNPFNPTTNITFTVSAESHVRISIHDMLGRVISTLVDGRIHPGVFSSSWNGIADDGEAVASGVYYYRLVSTPLDGSTPSGQSRRMILLK